MQVLEMRMRVLRAKHPDALTGMNNLAFTFKGKDRDEEALALCKDCVLSR
jgi:hypothetical protein